MIRLRENRHNSIAWILELSTLELLAAKDESMASTITWWEESTLNWESWEAVLVEGSAEICMCWEVFLLFIKRKRFCSVWLSAVFLEDYMYSRKMIGRSCPLACRLDVGSFSSLTLWRFFPIGVRVRSWRLLLGLLFVGCISCTWLFRTKFEVWLWITLFGTRRAISFRGVFLIDDFMPSSFVFPMPNQTLLG